MTKSINDIMVFTFLAFLATASVSSVYTVEEPSGDTLVNRRVLLLDFVNSKNSAEYAYLEDSIPEAFMEPLNRTKSFELLLRSTWKNFLIQKKFNKEDAFKEGIAIEAGKLAEADVVIIGEFVAFPDTIQIFAKAIEMSSGRVMVATNSTAPLDNNLFKAINALASAMSTEMKNKLPPLPQTVIINERIKYVGKGGQLSSAERKKHEETETQARKWRVQEQVEAQKWRELEQVQAQKWRAQEARKGWKENEAMLAANYWAEPLGFRIFGNIFLGTLSGAAMGFGSGLGFNSALSGSSSLALEYSAIPSGIGAVLGIVSGILVTVYDNEHFNQSMIGNSLFINTWTWWGLGSIVGLGISSGIGFLIENKVTNAVWETGLAIGSLTGLGIGIFFTILPIVNVPQKVASNIILDIDPTQTWIGYSYRF